MVLYGLRGAECEWGQQTPLRLLTRLRKQMQQPIRSDKPFEGSDQRRPAGKQGTSASDTTGRDASPVWACLEPVLSKTNAKYGYVAFRSVPLSCAQVDAVIPSLVSRKAELRSCTQAPT